MTERRKTWYLVLGAALVLAIVPLALSMAGGGGGPKGATSVALPLIASDRPTATSTATATPRPSASATATGTATSRPTATASATPSPSPTGTGSDTGTNYNIRVGPGYTDVSPKALVRTTGNRLYIVVSNCESYPCTDASQALRVYRANSTGVPSGFTLLDQGRAPAGVSQWGIAIDGGNTIHVVWNDRASSGANLSNLHYTTFSTTTDTWGGSVETVDSGLNVGLDGGGQGMQTVALALDASGAPHVVYLKTVEGRRHVYHRSRSSGGGWSAAVQLDDGVSYSGNQKAWHPNLAFDPAGRLLAVWQRGSFNADNDGTIFGRVRAANGSWGGTANISGDNAARVTIDQSTSLLVTPDSRYHITWIAAATDYIRYQYSDNQGQTWSANHPGGGTQATHNPALGYAAGKLRIYGHGTPVPPPDGHGEDLYYFEGGGGPGAWGSWTRFVTGADYDSSVNVRWAQFFNSFPNTIDLAYWNDNYPNVLYAGTDIKGP
jgi:hypothetical protein